MRLLILACSSTKRPNAGTLPALQRYDGPVYRTVRAYLRDHPHQANRLVLLILSAEFGLIDADTPIPNYDRRMTTGRALALRPQVWQTLTRYVDERGPFTATLINLGMDYLPALDLDAVRSQLGRTVYAAGGIGDRVGQLKRWLETTT